MHRVSAKIGQNPAAVTVSDRLLNLDDDCKSIIKERLVTAFGRQSKSFELEIENDGVNTCFDYVNSFQGSNNDQFISISVNIAHALADSQRQPRIPGGFLMVVECLYNGKALYVIIKAEPHAALGVTEMNIQTIKNIILSPEQKLYKAVYYEQMREVEDGVRLSKSDYRVVLFDSNVNSSNSLAQYFYQDFLGLSILGNSKLQTALFYHKMNEKIWDSMRGMEAINASDALRVAVNNNANVTINPHELITSVIPLNYRDVFLSDLLEEFPRSFSRDTSLIDTRLEKKTITLSEEVRISAPSHFFEENMSVEEGEEEYVIRIRR